MEVERLIFLVWGLKVWTKCMELVSASKDTSLALGIDNTALLPL